MGDFPAAVLALLMACLIGLLAHLLVFRPLRNAPALGKVIGAVGIMLYLQSVASINFGGRGPGEPGLPPRHVGPEHVHRELPRPRQPALPLRLDGAAARW